MGTGGISSLLQPIFICNYIYPNWYINIIVSFLLGTCSVPDAVELKFKSIYFLLENLRCEKSCEGRHKIIVLICYKLYLSLILFKIFL